MSPTLRGNSSRSLAVASALQLCFDTNVWLVSPRFNQIAHTRDTINSDGINSLTYHVIKVEKLDLFTKITVDVGKP